MLQADWERIAGISTEKDGTIGAVWLAIDRYADVVHLYDCCVFRREVPAVIAEGLNARGRRIPIAWEKSAKPMSDMLLDRGCNMIYEPFTDDDVTSEVISRSIWERMRSGRFKTDKRNAEWLDEYKKFYRQDQKIPQYGFPLMAATRNAFGMADAWACPEVPAGGNKKNFPEVAII